MGQIRQNKPSRQNKPNPAAPTGQTELAQVEQVALPEQAGRRCGGKAGSGVRKKTYFIRRRPVSVIRWRTASAKTRGRSDNTAGCRCCGSMPI